MADPLPQGGATVHTLPTRRAAGTGASKAPKASESGKGRLKGQASAAPGALGSAIKPSDAPKPTQAEIEAARAADDRRAREAQEERLAALTQRHVEVDKRLKTKKGEADEINVERKQVRALIQAAGVPLEVFDESYNELTLRTKRTDLEAKERARTLIRKVHGHPSEQQLELDLKQPAPEAVRSAMSWRAQGYQMGMLGLALEAPAGCVGPDLQELTAGWGDGQAVIARGLKRIDAEKEEQGRAAALLVDGETQPRPDWGAWDQADHQAWTDEQKAAFDVWYAGVDPELEPPGVPEVVMNRITYLDELADADPREAGDEVIEPLNPMGFEVQQHAGAADAPADDFEMTPAELAKQADRQALAEKKGATLGADEGSELAG